MPRAHEAGGGCGLVVATHGRHCTVESASGARRTCHPRGKQLDVVVGDRVHWQAAHDEGVITRRLPRRNLLRRQDATRSKPLAANLDQVLVVLAAEPVHSDWLLGRILIACEAESIQPLLALNKADLGTAFEPAWSRLLPYRDMGYPLFALAAGVADAGFDLPQLQACLQGRTTLLAGPSGAGKSTLLNRLVPSAGARTGELSAALQAGRHTTTSTRLHWLEDERRSALMDSPGFQQFGLQHVAPEHLAACMPDLRAHLGRCRFANCTHTHEPGCELRAAVAASDPAPGIRPQRYQLYCQLLAQLQAGRG